MQMMTSAIGLTNWFRTKNFYLTILCIASRVCVLYIFTNTSIYVCCYANWKYIQKYCRTIASNKAQAITQTNNHSDIHTHTYIMSVFLCMQPNNGHSFIYLTANAYNSFHSLPFHVGNAKRKIFFFFTFCFSLAHKRIALICQHVFTQQEFGLQKQCSTKFFAFKTLLLSQPYTGNQLSPS